MSEKIYSIFYRYTHCVEPVSCDEAYLEFAISDKESAYKDSSGFLILQNIAEVMKLVNQIRQEILESTRCPVSAGVSHNMFLARMATKKAKPNNISYFDPALAYNELKNTPLSDLPGIGWSMCKKLADLGILSGGDAQKLSLQKLTEILGSAKAKMLYDFCRGIDNRELKYDFGRKSIGVDVGWGVRFETEAQVFKFFTDLSEELSSRLLRLQTKAKCITLKIKKRHPDAPVEPSKFLGHGICENLSKSATVENPIDSASDIESLVRKSFKILNVKISDIRGVGFHASKLIAKNQCSKDTGYDFLNSWRVVKKKTDHPTSMKPLQSNFHAQTLVAVDHGKKSQLSETTMEQKSPTVETVTSTHQSSEDREGSSSPDSLYDLDKYQDLELPWKKSHDEKNHSKHSTRDVFSLGQCMDKIDYKTLRELPKSIQDEIRITFRLSDDEYSIEQESQKKSDLSPKVLHNLSTNSGQQQTSLLDQFKVIKAVKSNVSNRDARECRSVSGSRRTRKNDKSKRSGSSNSSNSKSAMKKSESIFSSGNIKYFNSCGKDAKTHADLKIDPNVLMELPISIRREVEREHLSHFRKTAFLTPAEAKSLTMPVSKPSLELSSANIHSFDNTEFSSRVNDLNSLKGLVDKLMDFLAQPEITSSEHPNKLATIRANEVFLNFSTAVCNEVDNYNLDDVYLVFKYFRRLCSQRTHLPWFKSLFNECLEFINLKLAKRYQQELHLLLERL